MFNRIYIEKDYQDHIRAKEIVEKFPHAEVNYINAYDEVFGRVKKPYLDKREDLNLFVAKKKGSLVKEAPDAYGLSGEPHYYFIHAYNCIYECNYCYLQGYFNSPDIVLFLNHNEILLEMKEKLNKHTDKVWFHAGEFSDSLALSHLSKELSFYHQFASENSRAIIELRTKSSNTKELEKLPPLSNLITSFSLSSADKIKNNDFKTPSLRHRLISMRKLQDLGHPIAIHLDPIIFDEEVLEKYEDLFSLMATELDLSQIEYLSLGVVRFTKDVFTQVKKNYPESEYLYSELVSSFDGKIRYPRPLRLWLLGQIKDMAIARGIPAQSVYLCME